MSEVKKIIAMCPAGLGNRIKCLVSSIKSCDEQIDKGIDAEVYTYWPLNDACGCEIKELFKPSVPWKELFKGVVEASEVEARNGNAELNKSWKFINNKNKELDFKYHKLSKVEINEFLPYFGFIKPAQDIQDTAWAFMNRYKESFDKGEVIGVHIRKGDFKVSFDGRQNISTEDKFIEKINALLEVNPNYKFLLCTEDEETEEKFKEVFHEYSDDIIINFPKRFRGRSSPESIKEAFVDILLLSKCPIILGTFLSTFTEIAWWIGGCNAQVCIPGAENREATAKVLSRLPQRGEGLHKKIWRRIIIWRKEGV